MHPIQASLPLHFYTYRVLDLQDDIRRPHVEARLSSSTDHSVGEKVRQRLHDLAAKTRRSYRRFEDAPRGSGSKE